MAKKADDSYSSFSASVKAGQIGNLYIFHGEERYLLEFSLADLRRRLCPDGLGGFNYKRFDGRDLRIVDLIDAIDTLPVFADRTLIEVHDFDVFMGKKKAAIETDTPEKPSPAKSPKGDETKEKQQLSGIFADLPDYACLVFVYDTIQYKPDGRLKLDKEMLAAAQVVEFAVQEQSKLTSWIHRRMEAAGKSIGKADAEYLALITDGYMATLAGEIEKVAAFSDSDTISRADIDAVVTPVLNAIAYKLTDAILGQEHAESMRILDELLLMREPAQKIIFSISLKMRQLLAARVCLDNKMGKSALMEMCGIKYDFQAGTLMDTARRTTLDKCRNAVLLCSEAAFDLNSAPEPESRLVELVTRLMQPADCKDRSQEL